MKKGLSFLVLSVGAACYSFGATNGTVEQANELVDRYYQELKVGLPLADQKNFFTDKGFDQQVKVLENLQRKFHSKITTEEQRLMDLDRVLANCEKLSLLKTKRTVSTKTTGEEEKEFITVDLTYQIGNGCVSDAETQNRIITLKNSDNDSKLLIDQIIVEIK